MQAASPIKQTLELPENATLVRGLLERNPALTRTGLAEELCRGLKLRDHKGDWQIASAAKALREMEAQGLVQLPAPAHPGPRSWSPTRLSQPVEPARAVPETLEAVQGLKLVEVSAPEQLQIWNELMLREHPLRELPAGRPPIALSHRFGPRLARRHRFRQRRSVSGKP